MHSGLTNRLLQTLTLALVAACWTTGLVAQRRAATAPRDSLRLALPQALNPMQLLPSSWQRNAPPVGRLAGHMAAQLLDRTLGDFGGARWEDGGLTVYVERAAVRDARLAAQRQAAQLVGTVIGRDTTRQAAVLDLPAALRTENPAHAAQDDAPLVVLVHGFGEGPWRLRHLADDLRRRDPAMLVATYGYANDAPIDELGAELAEHLHQLSLTDPRPVHLVGYSMGGLVCRWAVETADLAHGNVRRLVQVGSPNLGTQLAWLAWTVDTWHLVGSPDATTVQAVVRDGMGEAGWDMRPRSTLMRMLAARQRNPEIRYHNVLGDGGPLTEAVWHRFVGSAQNSLASMGIPTGWSEGLRAALSDSFELVAGAGDGVVSVRRGQLSGVEATVLPMDHRELMRPPQTKGATQPVFAAIYRWLAAP